jgi:hypothetical protein
MFIKRTSQLLSIFCLVALLSAGSVAGQQSLKCSIKVENNKIVKGQPTPVDITIENVSGSELTLDAFYSFELLKIADDAIARKFFRYGDSFWSPFDPASGKPIKLQILDPELEKKGVVVGRAPKDKLRLSVGEVRTWRADLTNLSWNASVSSTWPHEVLFYVVPKGPYWLEFRMRSGKEVKSNRVEVTVE